MVTISLKRRRQAIATTFIYMILIIVGIVSVFNRGINNLEHIYVLNIGIDILGMFMGYVLFICSLIDVQKTGSSNLYFFYLINITFLGLFSDMVAWLVDGIPSLRYINILDNTLYYICSPLEVYFFWKYMKSIVKDHGEWIKKADAFIRIGFGASIIVRVANLFLGFYFTVDKQGVYSRGTFSAFSMVYAFASSLLILSLIVSNKNKLQTYQKIALIGYVLAPVTSSIITIFVYGLSINFSVIMLVVLLMYCVISISQGREKVVNDRDLTMAAAIQENTLPHIFPPFPGRDEFDIYAYMDAAKVVGGDFYDFFMTDDDHICLVMADVSGKGVPASLFMMISKILIKTRLQNGESPGEALANVNNQLLEDNKLNMFVTVWLGMIEVSTGKGIAVNAGHEHPAIKRADGEYELKVYKHSPAVCIIEDMLFTEHEFKLNPGDRLFVYTDGVTEAINDKKELFGEERLVEWLNKPTQSESELKGVVENVRNGIKEFVGSAEQFDDITMLAFEYKGPQE